MIKLYIRDNCSYCNKVIDYAQQYGVELELKDIGDERLLGELISLGGKRQVPFLFDEDKDVMMYESDDIIEYLQGVLPK